MTESLIYLTVLAVIQETADAITLRLESTDQRKVQYKAGQFLTLVLNIHGKELRRAYSISASPDLQEPLSITVKRIQNGEVSRYLTDHVKAGMVLAALPPAGKFVLENIPTPYDLFLIGAGSGITPLFSLLKSALCRDNIRIHLLYSSRKESGTIFFNALNQLAEKNKDKLSIHYFFSDPETAAVMKPRHLSSGHLLSIVTGESRFSKASARFYLCGPFSFMRMAETVLTVEGYSVAQIRKENFVVMQPEAINNLPLIADTSEKIVELIYPGTKYTLKVPYGVTILEAALHHGLRLPYSCKAGICGTCSLVCSAGEVRMSVNEVLTKNDLNKGWILTCTGYVATPKVILNIIPC